VLPDGAKLAYEVIGAQHLGRKKPIVLVCGMGALRGDWQRLVNSLSPIRPVLIFDHRGIGDSTFSTSARDDEITVESLARDLLYLITSLGWKEIAICGFSMGGTVTQQFMLLPFHPSNPTPLPCRVSHVFLAGTLCAPLQDERYGLRVIAPPPGHRWTQEEKDELARTILASTFDPAWLKDPANKQRLDWWQDRVVHDRPTDTILKQKSAMTHFDFKSLHDQLPRDTQFLIIHGVIDEVVPFYCGEEIIRRIPWARMVQVGDRAGEVPNYQFGHHWMEYFDSNMWRDVVEVFLLKGHGVKTHL